MPYRIEVSGADHEGIVYHVTHYLAERGINIESMNTNIIQAPMSGTPLFMMSGIMLVAPDQPLHLWEDKLSALGDGLNVKIEVSPYTGS